MSSEVTQGPVSNDKQEKPTPNSGYSESEWVSRTREAAQRVGTKGVTNLQFIEHLYMCVSQQNINTLGILQPSG